MNSEYIWPQADSCVSLRTEDTLKRLVDDICRCGLDRTKYLKTPELFGELTWSCICTIRSNLKAKKAITNVMFCFLPKFDFILLGFLE